MSNEALIQAALAEGASPALVSLLRKVLACACPGAATGGTGGGAPLFPETLGYASFFALMPGDNVATAAGAPVLFPQDGPASLGFVRASASSFVLPAAGDYEIAWQVSVDEAGQLELRLDGVALPNTVVGRDTGTSQIAGDTIITAAAGSILEVINPAGNAAALTITPIAGGTHAVSATLTIKRLS